MPNIFFLPLKSSSLLVQFYKRTTNLWKSAIWLKTDYCIEVKPTFKSYFLLSISAYLLFTGVLSCILKPERVEKLRIREKIEIGSFRDKKLLTKK